MLTEQQERWLTALESGDYKQGKDNLHSIRKGGGEYFCCLGVACHLFKDELELSIEVFDITEVVYNNEVAILPSVVQEHLMLRDQLGSPIVGQKLSYLNDDGGKTFKEIAAIIRSNPSHYFYDKEIDNHVN